MATIIPIAPQSRVDEAWEEYAALAQKVAAEPGLLADRQFMQTMTKAEYRFKRLFMLAEQGS